MAPASLLFAAAASTAPPLGRLPGLRPFRISVPGDVIGDLRARLRGARWPDQLAAPANSDWLYGTELGYLRSLVGYWEAGYDWRAQESALNRAFPQFTAPVRGLRLHFVHKRCTATAHAMPLLLGHGWPGSVFEFHKLVGPLSAHFHVVLPSLPGFAFSEAPHARNFSYVEISRTYHALMRGLGYDRYVVHGGDMGSAVGEALCQLEPASCVALHTTMPSCTWPLTPRQQANLTARQRAHLARSVDDAAHGLAYFQIQGTKPQSLSYALNDSPVGLLAWILEKYRAWSDCDGDVENAFTKDEMLTNVMLYWVTSSIGSSIRLYFESVGMMPGTSTEPAALGAQRVDTPTAVAEFPYGTIIATPEACEGHYNLRRFTEFDRGGHFSALEARSWAALGADIVAFFIGDLGLSSATAQPRAAPRH